MQNKLNLIAGEAVKRTSETKREEEKRPPRTREASTHKPRDRAAPESRGLGRVLCIQPGLGTSSGFPTLPSLKKSGWTHRMISWDEFRKVPGSHDGNPESATAEELRQMGELVVRNIESYKPDVILAGSKGGMAVTAVWDLWRSGSCPRCPAWS